MLQAFIDCDDLASASKARLAEYLHGGHLIYDAEHDRLKPINTAEPHAITNDPAALVTSRSGDRGGVQGAARRRSALREATMLRTVEQADRMEPPPIGETPTLD